MKKLDAKSVLIGAAAVVLIIKFGDRLPVVGGFVGPIAAKLK